MIALIAAISSSRSYPVGKEPSGQTLLQVLLRPLPGERLDLPVGHYEGARKQDGQREHRSVRWCQTEVVLVEGVKHHEEGKEKDQCTQNVDAKGEEDGRRHRVRALHLRIWTVMTIPTRSCGRLCFVAFHPQFWLCNGNGLSLSKSDDCPERQVCNCAENGESKRNGECSLGDLLLQVFFFGMTNHHQVLYLCRIGVRSSPDVDQEGNRADENSNSHL